MNTQADWFDPSTTPPPFNVRLLAMLEGFKLTKGGKVKHTTVVHTVVITKTGRFEKVGRFEYGSTEYALYSAYVDAGEKDFNQYPFILLDDDGEEMCRTSDSIVFWAHYPRKLEELAYDMYREGPG